MSSERTLKDLLPQLELDEYIAVDLETTNINANEADINKLYPEY